MPITHTPEEPVTPRLLPAKRAARFLGIPYTSLRAEALAGRLPVLKRGKAWYFAVSDLDRYVDRSKAVIA